MYTSLPSCWSRRAWRSNHSVCLILSPACLSFFLVLVSWNRCPHRLGQLLAPSVALILCSLASCSSSLSGRRVYSDSTCLATPIPMKLCPTVVFCLCVRRLKRTLANIIKDDDGRMVCVRFNSVVLYRKIYDAISPCTVSTSWTQPAHTIQTRHHTQRVGLQSSVSSPTGKESSLIRAH
jgi:hypothetical protein